MTSAAVPTVFVIDDDDLVRTAIQGMLKSVGLRSETFGTPQEFLRSKRPDGPSCLVLDVRLPDRKSTRLNSSHSQISYAVFCLKNKKQQPLSQGHRHTINHSSNLPATYKLIPAHPDTSKTPSRAPTQPTSEDRAYRTLISGAQQ